MAFTEAMALPRRRTSSPAFSKCGIFLLLLALLQFVGPAAAGNYNNYNKNYNNDDGDDASALSDDDYIDLSGEDFDQVSLMPVSCVN